MPVIMIGYHKVTASNSNYHISFILMKVFIVYELLKWKKAEQLETIK